MECGAKLSKFDDGVDVDSTYYRSLIGSLRYLTCAGSDIMYSVGIVSPYMEKPKSSHLKVVKRYFGISKVLLLMAYTIIALNPSNLKLIRIVIMMEISMIERALHTLYFSCVTLLSHGHQRINPMSLY